MSTSIPYAFEPRPDTGFDNARLGMWLFLASEIMFFGGLFAGYILLRTGSADWPRGADLLNVPLASLNTLVLLASGASMLLAVRAARREDVSRCRRFLGVTTLLGAIFCAVKLVEYQGKLAAGLLPSEHNFLGLYFALTGVHFLHVVGGVLVLAYLALPGAPLATREPARYRNRVEVTALYWTFVDIVWLVIFPTFYLL